MIEPIQFPHRRSLTADQYEQQGGRWEPQVHFTGGLNDPVEIRFIEHLLEKYGDGVDAHFIYSPFPGTYSIELQFGDSPEDNRKLVECLKEYHAAFTSGGNLKKQVAARFAKQNGSFRLIAVRPALPPEVLAIDKRDVEDMITEIVGGHWEAIRYPSHLKLPLTIIGNDNGMFTGLPYNRWGIVGGFVVTRCSSSGNHLSLTDKQIEQVLRDLENPDDGYLNPACNVMNAFQGPFAIHGIPPSGWVPPGGRWFD